MKWHPCFNRLERFTIFTPWASPDVTGSARTDLYEGCRASSIPTANFGNTISLYIAHTSVLWKLVDGVPSISQPQDQLHRIINNRLGGQDAEWTE